MDDERRAWRDRQSALAEFGRSALSSYDLDTILHQACVQVARGLNVPVAKIVEALPSGPRLLLRAAVGVPPDIAVPGVTTMPGGKGSAAGYALTTGEAVVSHIPTETRFEVSEIVRKAKVVCSANVLIRTGDEAFGALEVDSLEERTFTNDDLNFLRTYAHLVAAAVERQRSGALVRRLAAEREAVMRELQHRVKNDLQVVTALLNVEARQAEALETRVRLENVGARVNALRLVHAQLYVAGQVGEVDLANYLRALCIERLRLHGVEPGGPIALDLDLAEASLDHDRAVAVGLITNEFLTNSLKHAFPEGRGTIAVAMETSSPGQVKLVLSDDGVGLPSDDRDGGRGSGVQLIGLFAQNLDAEVEWGGARGTRLTLRFSLAG